MWARPPTGCARSAGRCSATGSPSASGAAQRAGGSRSSRPSCRTCARSAAGRFCAAAPAAMRRSPPLRPSTARSAARRCARTSSSARRSAAGNSRNPLLLRQVEGDAVRPRGLSARPCPGCPGGRRAVRHPDEQGAPDRRRRPARRRAGDRLERDLVGIGDDRVLVLVEPLRRARKRLHRHLRRGSADVQAHRRRSRQDARADGDREGLRRHRDRICEPRRPGGAAGRARVDRPAGRDGDGEGRWHAHRLGRGLDGGAVRGDVLLAALRQDGTRLRDDCGRDVVDRRSRRRRRGAHTRRARAGDRGLLDAGDAQPRDGRRRRRHARHDDDDDHDHDHDDDHDHDHDHDHDDSRAATRCEHAARGDRDDQGRAAPRRQRPSRHDRHGQVPVVSLRHRRCALQLDPRRRRREVPPRREGHGQDDRPHRERHAERRDGGAVVRLARRARQPPLPAPPHRRRNPA